MSISVKIATLSTPNQSYDVNYVRHWGLTLTPPNLSLVDNNGNLRATAELWAAQDKARHEYLRAHALNGQTLPISDVKMLTRFFRVAAGQELLACYPNSDSVTLQDYRAMAAGHVCHLWVPGWNSMALYKGRWGWTTVLPWPVGPQKPTPTLDPWLKLEGVRVSLLDGSLSRSPSDELKLELERDAQLSLNVLHLFYPKENP